MNINYAPEPKASWGTLNAGSMKLQGRLVVAGIAGAVWFAVTAVQTGGHAMVALWTNLALVGTLIIVSAGARTVSLRMLTSTFCWGGVMLGIVQIIGTALIWMFGITGAVGRSFYIPLLEEFAKLVPVLFVLWRAGKIWRTTFGVTDILLLGAASGAGFSWVEDAFIRAHSGWPEHLPGLPVTEIISGHLIAGHAIWTALAAVSIGVALMMKRKELVLPVAFIGVAFSTADHVVNNLQGTVSSGIYPWIAVFTANGYLSILLFVLAVVGANGFDIMLVRRLPKYPEFAVPEAISKQWGDLWSFLVDRRMLAYAEKRFVDGEWMKRGEAALMVAVLTNCLIKAHGPVTQSAEVSASTSADVPPSDVAQSSDVDQVSG